MAKRRAKINATFNYEAKKNGFMCKGSWTIHFARQLSLQCKNLNLPKIKQVTISGAELTEFDSAGGLALVEIIDYLKKHHLKIELIDFTKQHLDIINLIQEKETLITYIPPAPKPFNFLYTIGKETIFKLHQIDGLIILIGNLSERIFTAFTQKRRWHFSSIVSNIDTSGIKALPIVGLLSFLIGVVLAYQMGIQLETYGANIFIAYLSGMAIFREFAPLITAIIVAGRTSSAYTAQIGSMKINEEIDALSTMGLSPIEILVVPKVVGLLIVFPLLIFWADVFSTFGAMFMSKIFLQVGYEDFLSRLQDSVGLKQMMLGLYKAPAFALLIALVGCFQGFQVESKADSVGSQTTKSVVQALFLIIVADAIYSVLYSWLDL